MWKSVLTGILFPWFLSGQISLPLVIQCGSSSDQFFQSSPINYSYSDPALPATYPSLRFGTSVHYVIPAPTGLYSGSLFFVEPNKTGAGQRILTVSIQGQTSSPIDIFQLTGGDDIPYEFPFIIVNSGGLIDIIISGVIGNAVISQIMIDPPYIARLIK